MFLLSKIISSFLLPPGLFITLLVVLLVLMKKKREKAAFTLVSLLIFLIYILSIQPAGISLIHHLEDTYPPLENSKEKKADYIVVLGGGIVAKSPETGNRGSLKPEALKRLIYAYKLSRVSGLPVITSGGRVMRGMEAESEAEIAERELVEMGLEKKRILREEKSRNTFEEAVLIREIYSPGTIILVTSAYHMPRSVACFEKNSIKVIPAPTDYKGGRGGYNTVSFTPQVGFLKISYAALKEYLGLLYYKIRY